MPYFNFDLVIGAEFKKQGGMILENTENAIDKADSLASELCIVRPELCSTGYAVRGKHPAKTARGSFSAQAA